MGITVGACRENLREKVHGRETRTPGGDKFVKTNFIAIVAVASGVALSQGDCSTPGLEKVTGRLEAESNESTEQIGPQ